MNLPVAGESIYTIRNQDEMVEAFRKIKNILGLTNAYCDELACMVEGHTDKVLGPSRQKEIGALTFNRLCWLFAVKFEMVVDLEQVRVMAEHWEDRQRRRPPEYSETNRISAKMLEKAKPHVAKAMGKAGAEKKMIVLSAKHRSDIARKAAKSRWRKYRRNKRLRAVQPAPAATA